MADPVIAGLDPGSQKCGLALLSPAGAILRHGVVPRATLAAEVAEWLAPYDPIAVVIGDGTGSRAIAAELARPPRWPILVRPEYGTTLAARDRYWREHPPRGLWRLIPTSMRVPPEPFDDLVAVILAERYLAELAAAESG